jgi:hypothetical protein
MRHLGCKLALLLLFAPGLVRADDVPLPCPCLIEASPCEWSVRAELLVWWLRSGRLPPLITTGPEATQGVLGEPGVRVVYGDEKIDTNRHLGGRFTLDYPINEQWTLRAAFFVVERNSRNFDVKSDGRFLVARPFVDSDDPTPSIVLAGSTPEGLRTGGFDGLSKIELFGEEAALATPLWIDEAHSVQLRAGLYCLQMRERLDFTGTSFLTSDGSLFGDTDRVRVHDRFYGVQVGLESQHSVGPLFLEMRGKAAVGPTQRVLRLRGRRIEQTPLEKNSLPFGFLVLPSNHGDYQDEELSLVLELAVNGGYEVADWCRVFAGYTLIRWSNTIRAGDQLDTALELEQQEGEPGDRPRVRLQADYFWAMGVSGGIEFRW